MGWTKVDKAKFLESCNQHGKDIMPQGVISKQATLFEDILETDNPNPRYQKVQFILKYPALAENPDQDPMAKQSARFTVMRHFNGPKKGELLLYKNERTGKDDVIVKSYPEAKIVNTTQMLRLQMKVQLGNHKGFTKFPGAIFITRLEFIFKVSKNAPKYMMDDLRAGTKIYFKDTKPDLDNLEKMIWDSMQAEKAEKDIVNAMTELVYNNDSQIVSKNCIFKRYGIVPGVIIEMEGYI